MSFVWGGSNYKREHVALCPNQTPSWYGWKIIKYDIKPEPHTLEWQMEEPNDQSIAPVVAG